MQYFVLPIILAVFSEILGTVFLNKLKIKCLKFNALIGFSFILAIYYIICFPLVVLNVKFIVLFLVTIIYFCLLSLYIFLNRKYIKISFNVKDAILVLLIVLLQVYFASRNTVGSLWRYDTITYTNMIGSTIYGDTINALDFQNGFTSGFHAGYSFQAYYKLASVLYYLINGICNVLHVSFFYFTQHTWMYPVLLYTFVGQMYINFIDELKIKNTYIKIASFLFFIFFMGNFYWNSEQAYLGNSFRMIMVSYCIFYLSLYFNNNNNKYLILLIIFNYAGTACANCNSTLALILTYMFWTFAPNNKNTFRLILFSVYLPLINCLFQSISYSLNVFLVITIIFAILSILEEKMYILFDKLNFKKVSPIIIAFILILLSYKVTHNLFNFDAFLNNMSGWSDMTWDYTDFSNLWRSVANVIYIILMMTAVVKYKESKIVKMTVLTSLVFFNPFAVAIQNEYMPVFYRNYDIVINYFTLFLGFKALECFEHKKYSYAIYCVLIVITTFVGCNQFLYHPEGEGFEKDEDYNTLLKMDNDTANTLLFMKDILATEDKSDIRVISSIYQIRTEFPYLKTLYNRNKSFNEVPDDYELYKIFYPDDYYGDEYGFNDAKYEEVGDLLFNSSYKYLILSKDKIYYDVNQNIYYSLTYKINEYYAPIYDNNSYSVYQIH